MKSKNIQKIIPLSYVFFSLVSLGLLALLTFKTPVEVLNFPFQKQLTGSLFMTICIIGILAGLAPSKCSQIIHLSRNEYSYKTEQTNSSTTTFNFEGHHPTCGKFSAHILKVGNKTYCAGCYGLVTGAIFSLIGSFTYFFVGYNVGELKILIFWLGFVGVTSSLFQYYIFAMKRGSIHFSVNVIFVIGAFLLLFGVNEINNNFILNLYLLILIVYWITTRIQLSRSAHKEICTNCDLFCEVSLDRN
ncbi:hypothetical protein KAS14_01355 [Candidatus Bathyarchaeota archaeon]|nr:hypothetical protein [Candidatus Bathyarchaeota archaeon]